MRLSDYTLAALFLGLAGYVAITAWGFPTMPGMRVGPGLFPIGLSIAMAIACVVLAVQGRVRAAPASAPASPGAPLRVIALVGSCGAFALGGYLGFVPATALALGWLMLAFGVRWRFAIPFAIFFAVVVEIVFVRVLRIPLPLGAFGDWGVWF